MLWLRYAILLIAAIRIGFVAARARRAPRTWTEAILPGIVLSFAPGGSYAIRFLVLEALAFGIAAYAAIDFVRHRSPDELPEERIAATLARFFPARISRWIAAEMVILGYAFYGIFHLFRIRARPGFGYTADANIRFLPLIFVVAGPPEALIFDSLIPARLTVLRLCVHILELWAFLWIYALYVSMRLRPHVIEAGVLRLHKGIMANAVIPIADIQGIEVDSTPSRAPLVARGTSTVTIQLARPVRVNRMFGPRAAGSVLSVSADNPAALRDSLCEMISRRRPS